MVKKQCLFIFFLWAACLNGISEQASRTFLYTRPLFQNINAKDSLWHHARIDTENKSSVHIIGLYQQAFQEYKIRDYFLMTDKKQLKISNSSSDKNISPTWLGLPTNFEGILKIDPQYKKFGFLFELRHNIDNLLKFEFLKDSWLMVSIPFAAVKNQLRLSQERVTNAAAKNVPIRDIITAFDNTQWNYGKLSIDKTRYGLEEIRIGFGTSFIKKDFTHLSSYSALSFPAAKTASVSHLFYPQLGFDGHIGVIWGAHFQLPLTRELYPCAMSLFLNVENSYLIRRRHNRILDLKNKEWSRYLLLRKKDQTLNETVPAVNILTQKVRISPRNIFDGSIGLRFNGKKLEAECSYGVWGRGAEELRLTTSWKEEYGIAGSTTNTTASTSNIKTEGLLSSNNDASFIAIKETDLDLKSGTVPSALVHRVQASIGCRTHSKKSSFWGAGAFIEISRKNTVPTLWGAWAKIGAAF